ncbi:MAG: flagellar basal body-associated FliL family protein [Myxococcota bacterium]
MAEEETTAEVEEPEVTERGRGRRLSLAGFVAVALAVGATALVFLRGGEAEQSDSADLASPQATAHGEAAGPAATEVPDDGIDYAAELDIVLPLARVSSEGSRGDRGGAHIGKIIPLDSFVVNISDRERDRYLKLKAELELSMPEVADELDQRMPQIRDLIISLLGSKSFEEVRTIEGKNFLREEILLRINALLVSGKIKRVFFTEFVVQ